MVERLVARGLCDVYVLMTNAGVSGAQGTRIEEMLLDAGVKQVTILGSTRINQQIQENRDPRGVWVVPPHRGRLRYSVAPAVRFGPAQAPLHCAGQFGWMAK